MLNPDPFLAHEALDRVSVISRYWDDAVLDHAFIASYPKLKAEAEDISDAIGALYQRLGRGEAVG